MICIWRCLPNRAFDQPGNLMKHTSSFLFLFHVKYTSYFLTKKVLMSAFFDLVFYALYRYIEHHATLIQALCPLLFLALRYTLWAFQPSTIRHAPLPWYLRLFLCAMGPTFVPFTPEPCTHVPCALCLAPMSRALMATPDILHSRVAFCQLYLIPFYIFFKNKKKKVWKKERKFKFVHPSWQAYFSVACSGSEQPKIGL